MKKLAIVVVAALISLSTWAQGKAGVIGGFTSSQLKIEDIDFKSGTGLQLGFVYNQPLILGFALQPELVYNVKKTSLADVETKMSYIELPVQLQWGIDLIALKPYVFAEPFVGYALGGSLSYDFDGASGVKKDFDLDKLKSRFEYGFSVGAGIDLLKHIQISAKYFWNFENAEITSVNDYWQSIKSSVKLKEQFSGLVVSAAIFF